MIRCAAAALLLAACASAHAASEQPADAIERAAGVGDYETALRLSAELLQRTQGAGPARIAALQVRLDALVDAGEWTKQSAALHEQISVLPDTLVRDALELSFGANDAIIGNNYPALAETAQKGLDRNYARPATFVAEMRSAAARAQVGLGKRDAAHEQATIARDLWHRESGVRSRRYELAAVTMLSQIEEVQGHADAALAHADEAVALATRTFGRDSLAFIRAGDQRASALEALDRFAEAREVREESLRIARKRFGDHHVRTALEEGTLGAHLQRTGNYAPAREHYAAAEAIMDALGDVGARDRLIIANNYANLLQEMGDEEGALKRYRVALGLVNDDRTRAIIHTNIGNTEFRLGHYEAAIAEFEQALPLREKAEGKDSAGLSFALEGLGSSALALKNFADAERYFDRAVTLRAKTSAPNHSQLNVLNFGLALSRWGLGKDADAFALAVQTAERQQSLLGSLATGFSEQQSVAFDNLLVPATALAVTMAAQYGDAQQVDTAWRLVMVERGLIARAEARRLTMARASADPQLAQLYKDWRSANAALGDGWVSSRTSAAKMSELQAAAEAAERALWARLGHREGDTSAAARPVAELAKALPKDGVLIAFTEGVSRNPARIVSAGAMNNAEDLYAFVLRPQGAPKLLRVGRGEAIGAQTRAWYATLRDPRSDTAQLRRRGAELRHDLFDSLGIAAARQVVFIVPLGELYRVNFAALPGDGDDRYLIEDGVRVHTLAHEGDLLLAQAPRPASRVLLAGAPQFGAPAGAGHARDASATRQLCARVAEQGFAALPGAERELDELRGVLRSALDRNAELDVIDGAAATKEHVLAALDGADVVHLATHGFSFDESCGGAEATTRGIVLDKAAAPASPVAQPLSGLAFSGADVGGGHAPIGVLSAGEMSTADLTNASWVVLSACDSGLGPIGHTEGVFGMRRALRLAGARTVVMSLWQADDAVTADLMQALYRARFSAHRDVPDAMAEAMQATLGARRSARLSTHPYYWAAFVGEGAWR